MADLPERRLTRNEKWKMIGCLVPPDMKKDLSEKVRENEKKFGKEDERSSESGFVRKMLRENLYPFDDQKTETKKAEQKKAEPSEDDI